MEWKEKLVFMLCICVITGIIGVGIGLNIASAMSVVSDVGTVGLIGFLVGFFAPIFIYMEVS